MKNFIWGSLGGDFVEAHKGETVSLPDFRIRKPQIVDVDVDFGKKLTAETVKRIRTMSIENGVPETKVKEGFEKNLMLFTGSTEGRDRYGDRILVDGWELEDFKKNPVFLGFHDYNAPAIGQALDVFKDLVNPTTGKLLAKGADPKRGKKRLRFLMLWAVEENPIAKILHGLYSGKDMRATSVGFIPGEVQIPGNDEERSKLDLGPMGVLHKKQNLLELSAVAVPALPDAIAEENFKAYRDAIPKEEIPGLRKLAEQISGIDKDLAIAVRAFLPSERKTVVLPGVGRGVIPANVSTSKAPRETAWSKPSLSDFTDKSWGDLTDGEKRKIAGHYAWADASPPSAFGALSLPHHQASNGAIVFAGISASAARFNQTKLPSKDKPGVKAHLRAHYRAFGEDVPEVLSDDLRALLFAAPEEIAALEEIVKAAGETPSPNLSALDDQVCAILSPEGDVEDDGPGDGATHPGDKLAELDALMTDVEKIANKEPEEGSSEDREGDQDPNVGDTGEEGGDGDSGGDGKKDGDEEVNRLVPGNISLELADPGDDWVDLEADDFDFENLDADARSQVAGFFAYTEELPPTEFVQLKLAHHRTPDGAVNLNGVRLSIEELLSGEGEGGEIPKDERRAVYDHLAAHFEQFDSEAPEFVEAEGLAKEDGDGKGGAPEGDPDPVDDGLEGTDAVINSIRNLVRGKARDVLLGLRTKIKEEFGVDVELEERAERKWRVVRAHKPKTAPVEEAFVRSAWEEKVAENLDLRRETCLIYDAGDSKNPRSYFMPHHLAEEGTPVIWEEVKTAMRHLLSRSIDLTFSEDVRKRAYFHLRTHFEQFEKEAPAFRTLSQLSALGKFLRSTAESLSNGEGKGRADAELVLDLVYMGFQAASSDAFELQALSFPKEGWEKEAASEWVRERGHEGGSVEETETAFVFVQRDEADFIRLEERRTGDEGDPEVVEIGGSLKSGTGLLSEKLAKLESLLESGITEIKQTIGGKKAGAVKAFLDAKKQKDDDRFQKLYEEIETASKAIGESVSTL